MFAVPMHRLGVRTVKPAPRSILREKLPPVPEPLPEGLYESLRTSGLEQSLSHLRDLEPKFAPVDPADAPEVLARHVARSVRRLLADERDEEKRAAIVNELMDVIHAPDERLVDGLEQLVDPHAGHLSGRVELQRPATPLSSAALLTNGPDEPTLGSELRKELSSADGVNLLCAFIRWHGLRVLEEPLLRLRERGVPLRVITTTYIGATERRAIDELVRRFAAEVRITYETQSTRLHAKAWLLRRNSGFDTAYVGSSNLSRSALVDGLEWNVRLSGVATPELLRKFSATFDTYWADPAFVRYDPATDADRLNDALVRSGSRGIQAADITLSGLENPPATAPNGDPRSARVEAGDPPPTPQPRRRGHRHRKDGHRSARLPPAPRTARRPDATTLRRPPSGDSAAVASDVPGGAGGRSLWRAVRRR